MKKLVNGIETDCTPEEEASILAEWAKNAPNELEDARKNKIAELSVACAKHITSGFSSSALGSPHTYDSDLESQINLAGATELATTVPYTCTDVSGVKTARDHTVAQMRQVFTDGAAVKIAALAKHRNLKNTVLAATTMDQITAVGWV